jgi:hypothetical protein
VASYTKLIPPGGEGNVTVTVRTKGYGGRTLNKTVEVTTNDPRQPVAKLVISGRVKRFARISPPRVILTGQANQVLKRTVSIVPEPEYPFRVLEAKPRKGTFIDVRFDKSRQEEGKRYLLEVENKRAELGRYFDTVVLVTDNSLRPELQINVYGNIIAPRTVKAKEKAAAPAN